MFLILDIGLGEVFYGAFDQNFKNSLKEMASPFEYINNV